MTLNSHEHLIPVRLGGLMVECRSEEDASAIAKAARILHREDSAVYSSHEINRLANALARYGRLRAARTLRQRALHI